MSAAAESRIPRGAERRCQAHPHCAASAPLLKLPVLAVGAPGAELVMECSLCGLFVCGGCAKRELLRLERGGLAGWVWQMACPQCGTALGDDLAGRSVLHSPASGALGIMASAKASPKVAATFKTALAHHRDRCLALLRCFNTEVSLEGSISLVERALAESPGEATARLFKALLCAKAGYPVASRHALNELRRLEGESDVPWTGLLGLGDTLGEVSPRTLGSWKARWKAHDDRVANRKETLFSPKLREVDEQLQSYRRRKIPLSQHVQRLFPRPAEAPEPVRRFLEALEMERTIDFAAVEADRARLIELLVQHMDPEDVQLLVGQALALRMGSLSQSVFYELLRERATKHGIDLAPLPAMSRYLRYLSLSDGIDPVALHTTLWETARIRLEEKARSPEDLGLILAADRSHLVGELLAFLAGDLGIARIPGTYASQPTAFRELRESLGKSLAEEPAPERSVPFWKRLFRRGKRSGS